MSRAMVVAGLLLFSLTAHALESIEGKVVRVLDGDTIEVLDADRARHRVRLTEIDAPERGQPWGNKARRALSKKIAGKRVAVEAAGTDRYGRVLGRILFEERDINRELVREGHAWAYRRYLRDPRIETAERLAQREQLGLWGERDTPTPPWEWRQAQR